MQVKVRNKSDIPYVGTFRDRAINIPAGEYIEMGRSEAINFLSQYSPVIIDGRGRHTQPKNLILEEDLEKKAEKYGQPPKFKAFDGQMFRTEQGRLEYEAKLKADIDEVKIAKPRRRRTAKPPEAEGGN